MTSLASRHLTPTALRLRVDGWAAEVIAEMRGADIRAVLLKGPTISRWLYAEDPDQRSYSDVDLIVSPDDIERARALLPTLGFVALPHPPLDIDVLHAVPFYRERDGASIDLHRSLHGLQSVPSERVWRVVSTGTERIQVGNLDVEIPGIPARLLHLALHVAHYDNPGTQPWRDLERGVRQSPAEEWGAAVAIARELGVEGELAVRLRRLPAGRQLADEFGLTRRGSRYYKLMQAIETGNAPGSAHSIWALSALPDTRARVAYVRGKLLPGDETLREHSALARGGHIYLAGALHCARVLIRLPGTLMAWARHYRE